MHMEIRDLLNVCVAKYLKLMFALSIASYNSLLIYAMCVGTIQYIPGKNIIIKCDKVSLACNKLSQGLH